MKSTLVRWSLMTLIAVLVAVVPVLYYRAGYAHAKRLREIEPGTIYRCGQLTIAGLADAVDRYQIRTVINLQDEAPDPDVHAGYFDTRTLKESEVCRRLGASYVFLPPALLPRPRTPSQRPDTIDQFLKIMDAPANYPVLIHCRAGLHRTGVLTAVFRMEYDGWPRQAALRELLDNGFGRFACSSANEYISQYILSYQPGRRAP